MNYRSYADLSRLVQSGLTRVPRDVDLVVGVPRSGLVPATMLSLALNLPLTDVDGLIEGRLLARGQTRRHKPVAERVGDCRHVLVIDDSVCSGGSLAAVRARLDGLLPGIRITYAAAIAAPGTEALVDLHFDVCPLPRIFEWNVMHHALLGRACLDIDGVLCRDPEDAENDDGLLYRDFLRDAEPLLLPSHAVAHLVTNRLEKYRPETEAWLARHGVVYGRLTMLDLPDAQTRRRLGCHAASKARVYRETGAELFIESEAGQAREIATLSGKPVLCIETQSVFLPGTMSAPRIADAGRRGVSRWVGRLRRAAGRLVGLAGVLRRLVFPSPDRT